MQIQVNEEELALLKRLLKARNTLQINNLSNDSGIKNGQLQSGSMASAALRTLIAKIDKAATPEKDPSYHV